MRNELGDHQESNGQWHAALFRTLPKDEVKRLAQVCDVRHVRKGEAVFRDGEPADAVWVVNDGWVSLVKRTSKGRTTTIFLMTPDEALCGISAFEHGTYSTGAVAATESQLIRIPAPVFNHLLKRYPDFSKQVLLTCCTRMRHMAEAISWRSAPVEQRITYTLLRLRATFGDVVPVTHRQLAEMAGTRLETSIRTIGMFKQRGWLSTTRGQITLLQPAHLDALLRE